MCYIIPCLYMNNLSYHYLNVISTCLVIKNIFGKDILKIKEQYYNFSQIFLEISLMLFKCLQMFISSYMIELNYWSIFKYCLQLTHVCFEVFFTSVVWTYDTFAHNFSIKNRFTKYMYDICWLGPDQHVSFKYFMKISLFKKISPR